MTKVKEFITKNFLHFNAGELTRAAAALSLFLENNNKLLVSLGGAMSTAQLGISLAEMIRQDKVHAISSTGANLEEDIFNLIAGPSYRHISNYKDLTPEDELKLRNEGFNRVTDVAIPESAVKTLAIWLERELKLMEASGDYRKYPFQFIYRFLETTHAEEFAGNIEDSWVYAAWKKNLTIVTPGWEDSTLGNLVAGAMFSDKFKERPLVRDGLENMVLLAHWYKEQILKDKKVGFLQIGGGISGDFAICVVPMLIQDVTDGEWNDPEEYNTEIPRWGYYCQISDSTPSYGSYSGAPPNEKITWWKLDVETPKYDIKSDATIVVPLLFAYVLGE